MAVAQGAYARRGRGANAHAAKQRRQRRILVGVLLALVAVVAFQVPRTLKLLGPAESEPGTTSTAGAAPSVTAATPPPAATPAARSRLAVPAPPRRLPARLARVPARDLFLPRRGRAATVAAATGEARTALGIGFGPNATRGVPRERGRSGDGRRAQVGYIVVLASLPTSRGRAAAVRDARRARAAGLRSAGVLSSSRYPSLRAGYHVVFSKAYRTRAAAQRAAAYARAHGFPQAYTRRIRG